MRRSAQHIPLVAPRAKAPNRCAFRRLASGRGSDVIVRPAFEGRAQGTEAKIMDQTVGLRASDRAGALVDLIAFVARSVDEARASDTPFYHLEFDRVFPEDVYAAMLAAMPVTADYRRMSGRRK